MTERGKNIFWLIWAVVFVLFCGYCGLVCGMAVKDATHRDPPAKGSRP